MLLNLRFPSEAASKQSVSIEESAALTMLLESYRTKLDPATKRVSPNPPFISLANGPEQIDFEELVRIREEYRARVSTIVSRTNTAPAAGANP